MTGRAVRRAVAMAALALAMAELQIGDDEQADDSRVATEHIKCDVCHALVDVVFSKATQLKPHSQTELGILEIAGGMCGEKRDMSPPFTQDYEIVKDTTSGSVKWKFMKKAPSESDLPQPIFTMDWRTQAMKKACDLVIMQSDSEIAELVYTEIHKAKTSVAIRKMRRRACRCKPSKHFKSDLEVKVARDKARAGALKAEL